VVAVFVVAVAVAPLVVVTFGEVAAVEDPV